MIQILNLKQRKIKKKAFCETLFPQFAKIVADVKKNINPKNVTNVLLNDFCSALKLVEIFYDFNIVKHFF